MNYRFIVGAITLLSGIIALVCLYIGADAVDYNFDAFSNPLIALNYSANHQQATLFLLLDMFGYYLLLLPLIFYLHQQYKFQSSWTPLITFSGLAYVLTGAIGAAILAAIWPALMQDYLSAADNNKEWVAGLFKTSTLLVTKGLWNILEVIFATAWWIGIGKLLYRENKWLGAVTIATGLSTLADAIGNMAGWNSLAEAGLNLYLVLGIAWPVVMGISIIRKTVLSKAIPQPAW